VWLLSVMSHLEYQYRVSGSSVRVCALKFYLNTLWTHLNCLSTYVRRRTSRCILGVTLRRCISSVWWLGYGLDDRGSIPGRGNEAIFFVTVSIPTLGPINPRIQWVPGTLSLWLKRLGPETDRSPTLVPCLRTRGAEPLPPNMSSWRGNFTFSFISFTHDVCLLFRNHVYAVRCNWTIEWTSATWQSDGQRFRWRTSSRYRYYITECNTNVIQINFTCCIWMWTLVFYIKGRILIYSVWK
jgi:hypothetical protein